MALWPLNGPRCPIVGSNLRRVRSQAGVRTRWRPTPVRGRARLGPYRFSVERIEEGADEAAQLVRLHDPRSKRVPAPRHTYRRGTRTPRRHGCGFLTRHHHADQPRRCHAVLRAVGPPVTFLHMVNPALQPRSPSSRQSPAQGRSRRAARRGRERAGATRAGGTRNTRAICLGLRPSARRSWTRRVSSSSTTSALYTRGMPNWWILATIAVMEVALLTSFDVAMSDGCQDGYGHNRIVGLAAPKASATRVRSSASPVRIASCNRTASNTR